MRQADTSWLPGWCIGTICYIDYEKVKLRASLADFSDRLFDGAPQHINGLNQYLFAYLNLSTRVIFRVTSVDEAEKPYGNEPSDRNSESYIFTAKPIGEIMGSSYVPGVIDLPMVGTNAYACDENVLREIVGRGSGIEIGHLVGYDIRPRLDIDALFSGHLAILGNTGSGKSTTARLLLEKVAGLMDSGKIREKASFVVFDLHDDYKFLSSQKCSHVKRIGSDDYHLPPGKLTIEDWAAILDPSKRIQKPLLERAVKYSTLSDQGKKLLYAALAYSAVRDTSTDSHAARKFQIAKYYQHIEGDLDYHKATHCPYKRESNSHLLEVHSAHDLINYFDLYFGNILGGLTEDIMDVLGDFIGSEYIDDGVPSIDRIIERNQKPNDAITIEDVVQALDFVFDEEEVRGNRQARSYSEGLVTQLNNLRERYSSNLFSLDSGLSISDILGNSPGMLVLDVSQIVDETGLKLFSNYIARELFQRNRSSDQYRDSPVYLVFDEAHRYIREADILDDSVFNRIAREGRKFGVYLTVISQIPSELSRVVLSQTGAFLIHRIQNSYDLEYVRRNVPSISSGQVARLPSFAPGTAAVLGSSLDIPLEIEIDGKFKDETPSVSMKSDRLPRKKVVQQRQSSNLQ